jgi:hypothetical protein
VRMRRLCVRAMMSMTVTEALKYDGNPQGKRAWTNQA